jgi:anti-sigma regulatory factor (Ser/Thr protein kinase)
MTEERTFPNATKSVAQARHYVTDSLRGAPPEVIDSAAVMVSELATNAVRHADSEFTLSIDRDAAQIRVAVTDAAESLPRLRSPSPKEHSGRGLQIVDALADEWGVAEMIDRAGKTVWFVLALEARELDGALGRADRRPAGETKPTRVDGHSSRAPRKRGSKGTQGCVRALHRGSSGDAINAVRPVKRSNSSSGADGFPTESWIPRRSAAV